MSYPSKRYLDELLERKDKFGDLGCLDFLIDLANKKELPPPPSDSEALSTARQRHFEDEKLLKRYLLNANDEISLQKKPQGDTTLKKANEIAYHIGYGPACIYAEDKIPREYLHALNVLYASAASVRKDEKAWLRYVNRYLTHFNVAPLTLRSEGTFFERFQSSAPKATIDGPLVSIIMPAYNAEKSLAMAANSILNQTWSNIELLIVDDCSQDNTWEVMQALDKSDPRVRIFQNSVNVGPYVSKNIAVSQAKGEWITGHDADDWAFPERIERQWNFCTQLNEVACMSGMARIDANGAFVRLNEVGNFVYDGATRSGFISLMVNARFFHDLLGYWDNVRFGGDSELLRRIEKLQNKPVSQLKDLTMLCYDNPEGLTNSKSHGHSESGGVSPVRLKYKKAFSEHHKTLDQSNSRYSFLSSSRPFKAPKEMLNNNKTLQRLFFDYQNNQINLQQEIKADVAIVTNLSFPGGNASSTLDEVEFFEKNGFTVAIIHCPSNNDLGRPFTNRYSKWKESIINFTNVGNLNTKILICRHPTTVTSSAFQTLVPKLTARNTFIVKNNSNTRANGGPVYDTQKMIDAAHKIATKSLTFCPISGLMRKELETCSLATGANIQISARDWNPTFDASLYQLPPKAVMSTPYRIGRHGRDGQEKWHESVQVLSEIYPNNEDFEISVLGGAGHAKKIFGGKLPQNWHVYNFGEIDPKEYLSSLDVFVYFPHSGLTEAFGRTIIEAVIAGVPIILPENFSETFRELAFYCDHSQVKEVIKRLAESNSNDRVNYLYEAQNLALDKYSSQVIGHRFERTDLIKFEDSLPKMTLSTSFLEFRESILKNL